MAESLATAASAAHRLMISICVLAWPLSLGLAAFAGCQSYHFGARSLYSPDIATIYVPTFESNAFRPAIGERLTEAVVKEIQLKSPYQIAKTADADSILTARVVSGSRRVLVEDFHDRPRELELNFQVEVTWLNRRQVPMREAVVEVPPVLVGIGQSATLIPEAGESVTVSEQEAIERLAAQIVATMEQPW
jgi:hypothetical protein